MTDTEIEVSVCYQGLSITCKNSEAWRIIPLFESREDMPLGELTCSPDFTACTEYICFHYKWSSEAPQRHPKVGT